MFAAGDVRKLKIEPPHAAAAAAAISVCQKR
jgi:hypothetical protein